MTQLFRGAHSDLFAPGGILGRFTPSKVCEGYTLFAPLSTRNVWLVDGRFIAIATIEKKTGLIKCRYGAEGELAHPHDPTLLGNGNILFFDNGLHRRLSKCVYKSNYSRSAELNPDSGKIEWEFIDAPPDKFYSSRISGFHRLPDGNTLICEGATGESSKSLQKARSSGSSLARFLANRWILAAPTRSSGPTAMPRTGKASEGNHLSTKDSVGPFRTDICRNP